MPRKNQFQPDREPHRDNPALELQRSHVSGPISFLNPTRAHFRPGPDHTAPQQPKGREEPGLETQPNGEKDDSDDVVSIRHIWRSRDNRKGRHPLRITHREDGDAAHRRGGRDELPHSTATVRASLRGIASMFTFYPYWDVSWWVATLFTWGSVVWVINAFFVWLPLSDPSTEFPTEVDVAGGVTAFMGATIFEFGSVLLMLEAVNENQTGCFGWAVETILDGKVRRLSVRPAAQEACQHRHSRKDNFVVRDDRSDGNGEDGDSDGGKPRRRSFRWLPAVAELKDHYIHELGFLASAVQLIGATIFWIAGFTGLPGILNNMSDNLTDGVYWTPQIVGGSCFVLSG
jgi:hypothetical protein